MSPAGATQNELDGTRRRAAGNFLVAVARAPLPCTRSDLPFQRPVAVLAGKASNAGGVQPPAGNAAERLPRSWSFDYTDNKLAEIMSTFMTPARRRRRVRACR